MSKLPNVATSIFATISEMAEAYHAVNLSQGFADTEVSRKLISLVNDSMKKGFNQYAPMPGLLSLREQIAAKTYHYHQASYNPASEITITSGATEGIFTTLTTFVSEGDEVIIFEPAYDAYAPVIRLNGGKPIYVRLKHPDYIIDWEEVKRSITARTRIIVINTPHNPTGVVFSESDMLQLAKIIHGSRIMVLSDEVYEHILFDGCTHQSVAKFSELKERSVVVSSFGKTFHTTGWKVGYVLAPEKLTKEIRKVHQFVVYAVNTPVQYAYAEMLGKEKTLDELSAMYQQKRDYLLNGLKDTKFTAIAAKGTYFQLIDYSQISNIADVDFAEILIKDFGLATIPVSVFSHEKTNDRVLRLCFAKDTKTLDAALTKLKEISKFDFSVYDQKVN